MLTVFGENLIETESLEFDTTLILKIIFANPFGRTIDFKNLAAD